MLVRNSMPIASMAPSRIAAESSGGGAGSGGVTAVVSALSPEQPPSSRKEQDRLAMMVLRNMVSPGSKLKHETMRRAAFRASVEPQHRRKATAKSITERM